jgi:hypothetical protein
LDAKLFLTIWDAVITLHSIATESIRKELDCKKNKLIKSILGINWYYINEAVLKVFCKRYSELDSESYHIDLQLLWEIELDSV